MIFLDTSFIVSLFNSVDANHDKAVIVSREIDEGKYGAAIISDYIFTEVATVMMLRIKDIAKVIKYCNDLMGSTKMLKIDDEAFKLSWLEFSRHNTSALKFSFIDCSNLAMAKQNSIKYIATFDGQFEKAGGLLVIN